MTSQEPAIAARVAERRPFVEDRDVVSRSGLGDGGGRRRRLAEPLDGRDQVVDVDRLRQIAVHAGCQAAVAVALHRVRGQRDDRQMRRAPWLSRSRIALRRLEPAHLRHLQVHQHDVERRVLVGADRRDASRPFSTAFTVWPRFLSSVVTSLRFTGLSSATSTCSGRARRAADPFDGRLRRPCLVATPKTAPSASSRSECLTGLVRNASTPSGAARISRVGLPDRGQHHDRHLRERGARCLTRRASMKPSTSGIWQSVIMTSNALRPPPPLRSADRADVASLTVVGAHAPAREHLLQDAPVRRVVVDRRGRAVLRARGCAASARRPDGGRRPLERRGEVERAAAALRALDPDAGRP